jgi:hypothetical protein
VKVKELLAEQANWPKVTRAVAAKMRDYFDATFTNDEYFEAAMWLLSPRASRPGDTTQRVVNMFIKLNSGATPANARNMMYQEFIMKPGLARDVYYATTKEKQ